MLQAVGADGAGQGIDHVPIAVDVHEVRKKVALRPTWMADPQMRSVAGSSSRPGPFHHRMALANIGGIDPGLDGETFSPANIQVRRGGDAHKAGCSVECESVPDQPTGVGQAAPCGPVVGPCRILGVAIPFPPTRSSPGQGNAF